MPRRGLFALFVGLLMMIGVRGAAAEEPTEAASMTTRSETDKKVRSRDNLPSVFLSRVGKMAILI